MAERGPGPQIGKSRFDQLLVDNLADLRSWLTDNQKCGDTLWLVRWRKTAETLANGQYMPMLDIIDELLCVGWVDSVVAKRDAASSYVRISPRNPKSAWSKVNKDKVDRLTKEGRMQPTGMALVDTAKANGMWDFLNDVDAGIVPPDLEGALMAQKALEQFETLPFSVRRGTLELIKTAKTAPTREKRIAETVKWAALGKALPAFRRD
ncbi:MAG: YdeI/OmpD-associated family protein [Pseudomonadota bacterium]